MVYFVKTKYGEEVFGMQIVTQSIMIWRELRQAIERGTKF